MIERKVRQRKCKSCSEKFTPRTTMQIVCSVECAKVYTGKQKAKQQAKERRDARASIKTRGQWLREAQAAFNGYIRARDEGKPCVSCGKGPEWQGQWHASHYYATSIRPNLRFDEKNVHKACAQCNKFLHGNLVPYRAELAHRIGKEELNRLDRAIEPAKYSTQDLIGIKAYYLAKTKELTKGRE